jgi:hypothetical protein
MLRLTLLYTVRPESFDSPLTLSPSEGERFAQDVLVDQPPRQQGLMVRQAHHDGSTGSP